ncbi:polyadenylate-binding protein RBP47B'-like [Gossypium australe]|uniref:Polyadenylate-binding protein RBP47B'-like n=1 Tax=Gossypium australe TaxID=47621 RepID=A0A5B6UQ40_9ROSI|nr:polyadenylate-binding protein RBP47B'-like [Gossypium australe]
MNNTGPGYHFMKPNICATAKSRESSPHLHFLLCENHMQCTEKIEGSQEMAAMTAAVPGVEQREESYDPLATPDVDKLNATYLSVHGSAIVGRPLWLRTSFLPQA